jgi:centromeric protein E
MTGSAAEAGVVRLAVRDIFHRIRSQSTAAAAAATNDGSREYLVRVSYLEIYNEQIYDLLSQPSPSPSKFKSSLQHHHLPPSTSVRIFESRTEGVVVRGLREEIVTCPEDVFALLDAGDARRRVGCTGMNKTSSRSHSVFRLVLESRVSSSKGEGSGGPSAGGGGGGIPSLAPSSNSSINSDSDSVTTCRSGASQHSYHGASIRGPVRISSLSLVDLAGSESVKYTGSTGVRQKEGQYINKSLLTLGHVVHKLSEMSLREKIGGASSSSALSMMAPNEHIPYRDSKLTRLLQPSLGGNAQVCIICNISPALSNLEESRNTLKFAMRAKKIRQHARITEVADEKTLLRSYREEIEELKRQLREARKTSAETQHSQQQHHQGQVDQTPKIAVEYSSSSEDEDQDDTHVLVSAIANLESLILKAGAKSTQKGTTTTVRSNSSIATTSDDGNDESSLPSRALDAALMRAESEVAGFVKPKNSPPAVTSDSPTTNKSSLMTPATTQRVEESDEDDHLLLEELHRIQDMLGSVMKKKRKGGGGVKSTPGGGHGNKTNNPESRTPERDAEMEQLRVQLQEQEVASTMRKADSSFLQGQLNVKDG